MSTEPTHEQKNEQSIQLPPAKSWIWIKDTAGYPSVSVTFVTIAFWATTLWFVFSIFAKIWEIEIRPFDPTAASAYLGPLLALYFGRRWTDAKLGNPGVNTPNGKNG